MSQKPQVSQKITTSVAKTTNVAKKYHKCRNHKCRKNYHKCRKPQMSQNFTTNVATFFSWKITGKWNFEVHTFLNLNSSKLEKMFVSCTTLKKTGLRYSQLCSVILPNKYQLIGNTNLSKNSFLSLWKHQVFLWSLERG